MCFSQSSIASHRTQFEQYYKLCLSQNYIASHRKYSKTISNCVSAEIPMHLIDVILRQFQIVFSQSSIASHRTQFEQYYKLCLSQNYIASHRKYSKTISNCVSAEIPMHLIDVILRQFQIVFSQSSFASHRTQSKQNYKLCLRQNSIASDRNYCRTFTNCVLAENPLHLIEIILRAFQNVAQPKFHYISSKIFYDTTSKLCLSQNSIASHRIYS